MPPTLTVAAVAHRGNLTPLQAVRLAQIGERLDAMSPRPLLSVWHRDGVNGDQQAVAILWQHVPWARYEAFPETRAPRGGSPYSDVEHPALSPTEQGWTLAAGADVLVALPSENFPGANEVWVAASRFRQMKRPVIIFYPNGNLENGGVSWAAQLPWPTVGGRDE